MLATTVFDNNDDNTGDGCAGALCGLQVDKVPTVVAAITHHHKAEGKLPLDHKIYNYTGID